MSSLRKCRQLQCKMGKTSCSELSKIERKTVQIEAFSSGPKPEITLIASEIEAKTALFSRNLARIFIDGIMFKTSFRIVRSIYPQ